MCGNFWVWDARLTSVLILLFLYLGYIGNYEAFDEPSRGAPPPILCLVGSVNLSIIARSTGGARSTSRPRSCARPGLQSTRDMLLPLVVMWAGFCATSSPCIFCAPGAES